MCPLNSHYRADIFGSLASCAHNYVDLTPGTLPEKARAVAGDGGVSEFCTYRGALPQNVVLLLNQQPLSLRQVK